MWLGEFDLSAIVDFKFTTRNTTGAPTTLSGSPAISVYKSNSTTESTSGVTLTVDFDSRTGLNHVRVDLSSDGTFYATANEFQVVITAGTVGGTSVVGETVGHFSIRNRAGLKPTTAGRTLVVDASGLADANMVKMGPTGSGTAQTARDIGASVLLSAGTSTGQLDFTSGVVKANMTQILGTAVSTPATAGILDVNAKNWGNSAVTGMPMPTYTQPTGFLAATFPGTVASTTNITAGTITTVTTLTNLPSIPSNWITAAGIASGAFVAAVWDGAISGHTTVGTFGGALNAASSAGDPWATSLPGAYSVGTAGNILGNNLNAAVGTVSTNVSAIKVKTDQLTFTVANQVDANALTGGGGLDAAGVRGAIGMASADMDSQLDAILAASGGGGGSGSVAFVLNIQDTMATPLDGAEVWVTTDELGTNVVAGTLNTDAFGNVTFHLDPGVYYAWVTHSGYNATNPTAFTVS